MTAATDIGAAPSPVWDAYWDAVSNGDGTAAVRVALEWLAGGARLVDVIEGLVAVAQFRVGELWAANKWNVAEEHRATSISEDVVAALSARIDPAPSRGRAVVTCVDGEWHSLPSRMVTAVLREAGWEVQFLGASVPVAHLTQFLQDTGPDVTALSCSVPTALPRARQMIEASRQVGVPVLAGGSGFGPAGRWGLALGANRTAARARDALDALDAPDWPDFTDPAPPGPSPDRSAETLWSRRREMVSSANRRLWDRWPPMGRYDERQLERTEEDLGFLVDFLAAALYVDDAGLYTGFVGWMAVVLEARWVPRVALGAGLEVTAEAVAELPGDHPRAAAFIGAALQSL